MSLRSRLTQITVIVVVQLLTIALLVVLLPGFHVEHLLSGLAFCLAFIGIQVLYWWLFVTFFSWLPVWLYPIVTFVLCGAAVVVVSNFFTGIAVEGIGTGVWIALALTAVNAVLAAVFSLGFEWVFDRNVTRKLVAQRSKPIETDVPGLLFLEIDGLGEMLFRRALAEGHMPTLKLWLDESTHMITGWETDFTSQTGAMQPGILLGNNAGIPAYRWWDRQEKRLVQSGNPRDLVTLEEQLSNGRGLLNRGGASRGNMYSGDASENMLTFSALLDKSHGRSPGFYAYLINPYVVARLFALFALEVGKEWWQAWQQRRRNDKYVVSARTPWYAFFRAFIGPFIEDLTTFAVIGDVLRGVPAIYALYAGYDDVAHFAGMYSPEAFETLRDTDRYFARIERAMDLAPRPYHIVVLSDHGQSIGPTFQNQFGASLEELVKGLLKGEEVYSSLETNEAWDNVNAFLSESVNADTRAAGILRRMLNSRTHDGVVAVGPERSQKDRQRKQAQAERAEVIVLASGCTGLINFADANGRMSYEEIQDRYPDLIPGLVVHPGIGWVLVRSRENGNIVLGRGGIHFLDADEVEGADPLAVYGPNAAQLLRREASFERCPDLLVNTKFDPETEELCGFENQVSHHGGLGGPQNYPFIFHPTCLSAGSERIVRAESVFRLLRGWRDQVQGSGDTDATPAVLPDGNVSNGNNQA